MDLPFWDEAWEGLIEGLLKKRPLFHTGRVEGEYREFQSLDDMIHCAMCLNQIEILDELFHILLIERLPAKESFQGDLTWKSLLLTLWARHELGLPLVMEPIMLKELKAFFWENLWEPAGEGFCIKDKAKISFLDWLIHASKLEIDTLNRLARTFESLFDELESEYRGIRIDQLDPRLIRLFWLKSINGLLPKHPLP